MAEPEPSDDGGSGVAFVNGMRKRTVFKSAHVDFWVWVIYYILN